MIAMSATSSTLECQSICSQKMPKEASHNRIRGRFRRESRCEFTDKSHNNQPWFCLAEYFEGQLVNTCLAWIVLCRCNVPSMITSRPAANMSGFG
jgi:hypothetical protein